MRPTRIRDDIMKKNILFTSLVLVLVTFCIVGCGTKKSNDYDNSKSETQEEMHKSIEEVMYQQHGNYAVFESDYSYRNKQIWIVFLRDEEVAIFILSNNLNEEIVCSLRYDYEIRGNKLRFYNGYKRFDHHYPETSAEIFLDGEGVTFINMKQYGNRRNVHISATLSNESLSDQFLDCVRRCARM